MLLYSSMLAAVLVLGAPYWLARMITSGRYRAGLLGRLGRVPAELLKLRGQRIAWVHAVSVGETMAASRLIAELKERLPDCVIVVSTTTQTGQRLARERLAGIPVFYMPLDFAFSVRRYLHALQPKLVVLMESELWPRLLVECGRREIPVAVVNARVSDRSLPRYLRLRVLWKPLFERLSLVLAQSDENAARLKQIGVPAERVRVSGNLKYDIRAAGTSVMASQIAVNLPSEPTILVAGSTLEGEEKLLLEAWPQILRETPDAVMVLAPRHPERFAAVGAMAEAAGFTLLRATEFREQPRKIAPGGIFLLNTIGDLASMYSLGTVAFVGGSLVRGGGHNPLEPARFRVPVVMGPSFENFREIVEAMQAAEAIRIVEPAELAQALLHMFAHRDEAQETGRRGQRVFETQAGATGQTVDALLGLVQAEAVHTR
ncbi:MAG: 3-deoxy-D-manno-octulosonic acid transferase [Acidobacteriaceae bacterium]|nr:3-deoxy-D-manno-octulosonic acid transferase [Acidobacteriaceae bacterium]